MEILVIHAHTANRGDESAIKAMVDEILGVYPNARITIALHGITKYPNMPKQVELIDRFPKVRDRVAQIEFVLAHLTAGKFVFTEAGKKFMRILRTANLVIHAPGGPSIGDIYKNVEFFYLWTLDIVKKNNIPYMFYAPSMGPFKDDKQNKMRRPILLRAERVIVRDPISLKYVEEFVPEVRPIQTLDSALQHDIDMETNQFKFDAYSDLVDFMSKHKKCIGITITELDWHPSYKYNEKIKNLHNIFGDFIKKRIAEGYGIIFVPQLYGTGNDSDMMRRYMETDHCFMVDSVSDEYDSYFQQFLIGKLYAVVGMRYHSNIFSAKMGTPFLSISYEQKMKGFMQTVGLEDYCIDINFLDFNELENRFNKMISNYSEYKNKLKSLHSFMKEESYRTTTEVINILNNQISGKSYDGIEKY